MAGSLEGTVVGKRYRVGRTLGVGGSASVYEAEDITFGRIVALKVPHGDTEPNSVPSKRLIREARASAAVGHPNVCEVSELGQLPDGTPYVVMERLRGETLRDRLQREHQLPIREIVDLMMQVLSGLGAAHERGIVHRDIKPDNIFLVQRAGCPPLVKILDFGCVTTDAGQAPARMTRGHKRGPEELTATGMVVGTPWYLAPEQLRGVRAFDGRVDLYACGVVLYETTTGRRPFAASEIGALCKEILGASPPPISALRGDAPVTLTAVIAKAMANMPNNRFPNALAFQRALADVTTSHTPTAPAPLARTDETLVQGKGTKKTQPTKVVDEQQTEWDPQPTEWDQQLTEGDQPTLKKPGRRW